MATNDNFFGRYNNPPANNRHAGGAGQTVVEDPNPYDARQGEGPRVISPSALNNARDRTARMRRDLLAAPGFGQLPTPLVRPPTQNRTGFGS